MIAFFPLVELMMTLMVVVVVQLQSLMAAVVDYLLLK
jgi:hypothetical protein